MSIVDEKHYNGVATALATMRSHPSDAVGAGAHDRLRLTGSVTVSHGEVLLLGTGGRPAGRSWRSFGDRERAMDGDEQAAVSVRRPGSPYAGH